ncbi:uncharacterized protein EDB93DRAFT_1341093 [Suillus bovinus]|uniref:uncharacterized protein n=1 Tax=Suillus bovinus TaxID=48563 RepID=UPI001B8675D9|nr:uncharacterized protein EDB93DRAFT_1341093 [Suillus bovinus]KAG2126790.1 hypothetical protein EDB93DRAFT_1341093 [Suillus bovinus]
MFTNQDSATNQLLLLIKNSLPLVRIPILLRVWVVEEYLRVQLGMKAFNGLDRALWLGSRVLVTNYTRIGARLSFGRPAASIGPMNSRNDCSVLCVANGDTALAVSDYDTAIDLYSAVINLHSASDTVFANRSKAKLSKMLWTEALLDAQKVIEIDSLSYHGYKLKHAALHGAQRYDEAIQAFQMMLSKLDNAPDIQTRKLRQQYLKLSEVEGVIQRISAFKMSTEYKEIVSSTITHGDLHMKHIEEVVKRYFQYAMLSHRWEGKEPLLQDIEGISAYDSELDPIGGMTKLRSSAKLLAMRSNNVELQESVNSMFVWYHHSALTIVYLSDVPLRQSLAHWHKVLGTRRMDGSRIHRFQSHSLLSERLDLYQDDHTPNHKDSIAIMQELKEATGIDQPVVPTFRSSMHNAREKLHWASTRVTTHYGEKQDKALGRLLQEIVARSGDITGLDWVGKSSEFNSCLPASITHEAPPCRLPPLPEDEIQSSVLRCERRPAPENHFTYEVKADGLVDLLVTTAETIVQFWPARPTEQNFVLELPDFVEPPGFMDPSDYGDDTENEEDYCTPPSSPLDDSSAFSAFLLAQQRSGEYKRIATDRDIIGQVNDVVSVGDLMDIRTIEIL